MSEEVKELVRETTLKDTTKLRDSGGATGKLVRIPSKDQLNRSSEQKRRATELPQPTKRSVCVC